MINTVAIAKEFYSAMVKKDVKGMEIHLDKDIKFRTPLGDESGKEAYLTSLNKFINFFKTLELGSVFGSGDEVMLAYNMSFFEREEDLPVAVLLHFNGALIDKIDLYFDPRIFEAKKEEIYS